MLILFSIQFELNIIMEALGQDLDEKNCVFSLRIDGSKRKLIALKPAFYHIMF